MDRQYVATIELRPTVAAAEAEEDPGDRDHLLELHEMLEAADDEHELLEEHQVQELLLCHDCFCRFREDPFSQDAALHVGFSDN